MVGLIRRGLVASGLCIVALATACGNTANTATTQATTAPAASTSAPTSTPPAAATNTPAPSPTAAATSFPPTESPAAASTAASDLPALSPENAPQTPGETAAPQEASEPTRIVIPALGLDLPTVSVGLDAQQVPIVPKHDVGWFTASSKPGERSNVILWGHVLRWTDSPEIAAPFERIHELQPGAEIVVVTADGQEHRYGVTQQIQTRPDETQLLYPTLSERITLVSCIGDKVVQNGTLTKEFRLVTIAEPLR
jgi:sortase (surface protein transpeptidase)